MLFIRWTRNQEGRLVCAWGGVRKMGVSPNLASSSEKSQLAENGLEDEEGMSCAGKSSRDFPVLVWVNPKRRSRPPSRQSGLQIPFSPPERKLQCRCNTIFILFENITFFSGMRHVATYLLHSLPRCLCAAEDELLECIRNTQIVIKEMKA